MPVLRSKVEFCSKKMLEASIALTKELSKLQVPYITTEYFELNDDTGVPTANVPLDINIPQHVRCDLIEAKEQIDYILEKCRGDKGF